MPPAFHFTHFLFVAEFVYNIEPYSQQGTRGGVSYPCTHTHVQIADPVAAAGSMPSCLGLSMCRGWAVCPHQCQHVTYMYTAPGGPVCVHVPFCSALNDRIPSDHVGTTKLIRLVIPIQVDMCVHFLWACIHTGTHTQTDEGIIFSRHGDIYTLYLQSTE